MLVAFVALLIATSSTAYAAGLAANSVGHIHMKDNAIASPEVANGSLKAVDVAAAERVKFRGITRWHNVGAVGEVQFGATFSNYSSTINPIRFRREGDVVRLDGQGKSSQVGLWGDWPLKLVFTLPSGFRPMTPLFQPITGANMAQACVVSIAADGGVYLGSCNQSGFLSLRGVTFTTS